MELREFVAQTLRDVVGGIQDAQQTEGIGGYIAPTGFGFPAVNEVRGVVLNREHVTVVEFDVSVTADESAATGGKGGARIGVRLAGIGGEMTSEEKSSSGAAHRIKFGVLVMLPQGPRTWGEEVSASKKVRAADPA
jgi:hypothetical protein